MVVVVCGTSGGSVLAMMKQCINCCSNVLSVGGSNIYTKEP